MKRRLWTAAGLALLLCVAGARATDAQVSCSPKIPRDTIHDEKAMSELQQKGFTSLRCGER